MNRKTARHGRNCKICRHPDRVEIETAFLDWQPATRITKDFRLGSRQSLTRHAQACGLIPKRLANIQAALSSIVERGMRARGGGAVHLGGVVKVLGHELGGQVDQFFLSDSAVY